MYIKDGKSPLEGQWNFIRHPLLSLKPVQRVFISLKNSPSLTSLRQFCEKYPRFSFSFSSSCSRSSSPPLGLFHSPPSRPFLGTSCSTKLRCTPYSGEPHWRSCIPREHWACHRCSRGQSHVSAFIHRISQRSYECRLDHVISVVRDQMGIHRALRRPLNGLVRARCYATCSLQLDRMAQSGSR